jgi:uncharacterized surface protein with fasciclin (FAS1) repeats
MNKRNWLTAMSALSAATLLALAGCATTPTPVSITDSAARTPQLSTLSKLIHDAGLDDTLRGPGPFTVFAPTDEAFKAVPAKTLAELAANKELLVAVLTYHVLPGKLLSTEVKNGPAKTVNGASLALYKSGDFLTVEDAVVQKPDVPASNGVIHLVDRVLMPPKK